MSRSAFAVPSVSVARKIIDAAPAAGMFGKHQAAGNGVFVVIDHDEAYQEKAESLVRSFIPSAKRRAVPLLSA
jgi:hypothetical protein